MTEAPSPDTSAIPEIPQQALTEDTVPYKV